jgi:hypothetical protein
MIRLWLEKCHKDINLCEGKYYFHVGNMGAPLMRPDDTNKTKQNVFFLPLLSFANKPNNRLILFSLYNPF